MLKHNVNLNEYMHVDTVLKMYGHLRDILTNNGYSAETAEKKVRLAMFFLNASEKDINEHRHRETVDDFDEYEELKVV